MVVKTVNISSLDIEDTIKVKIPNFLFLFIFLLLNLMHYSNWMLFVLCLLVRTKTLFSAENSLKAWQEPFLFQTSTTLSCEGNRSCSFISVLWFYNIGKKNLSHKKGCLFTTIGYYLSIYRVFQRDVSPLKFE